MRQIKVFKPGLYRAIFQHVSMARNGRVRLVFTVLNDVAQDYENVATDKYFIEGTAFANDFVKTYGTTPLGLKNRGFKVKLGHTTWGGPTILNWDREDFVLPVWFREAQEKWQSKPGAKAAYVKAREGKDPKFAAANRIRKCTWESLVLGIDHASLLGCDSEALRRHIQRQFKEGMSWKNYASHWTVDHKVPITSFELTDINEVRRAAHYSNLVPMLAADNVAKYNAPTVEEGKEAA